MPWLGLLLLSAIYCLWLPSTGRSEELTWSAKELYARAVADRVVWDEQAQSLRLAGNVQYEDDGPAAGYSYHPNVETLAGDVWIKKQLVIDNPAATVAKLFVGRGGNLRLKVNGQETSLTHAGKIGNYWNAYRFDPAALKKGLNEFVLFAAPDAPPAGRDRIQVWIARDDEYAHGAAEGQTPPNRSFKSIDGGKTWSDKDLGEKNNVDGEYYVRVVLEQHAASGTLTLPVVDAGNLAQQPIGPPIAELGPVEVAVQLTEAESAVAKKENSEVEVAAEVMLQVRGGTTFAVQEETWSDWQDFPGTKAVLAKPRGRFLQARVVLKTNDPLRSPQLKSLTISASPARSEDWTKNWRLTTADNPAVRRSPVPFQYEPFDDPQLKQLREQEQIDELVKGTETQFEAACEIAKWSAKRLSNLGHLKDIYPEWNSLKILAKHEDGTPVGGFCQQYNLLFLQACLSQGLTVRAVSVGPGSHTDRLRSGHETVELWSDDYRKWVYLDGNTGWYIKDQESQIPLSIWEVRQRQLAALAGEKYPSIEMVKLLQTRYDWPDLSGGFGFAEMRLIPRNNFLSQRFPLPLNQGMRGWFWPGHWVSADQPEPVGALYHHRLFRQEDAEWTLNHAHVTLEATVTPGEVRVHLDSETPGWTDYLVKWNDGPETSVGSVSKHKLRPGVNRLTVVPRNSRGWRGGPTFVEVSDEK